MIKNPIPTVLLALKTGNLFPSIIESSAVASLLSALGQASAKIRNLLGEPVLSAAQISGFGAASPENRSISESMVSGSFLFSFGAAFPLTESISESGNSKSFLSAFGVLSPVNETARDFANSSSLLSGL